MKLTLRLIPVILVLTSCGAERAAPISTASAGSKIRAVAVRIPFGPKAGVPSEDSKTIFVVTRLPQKPGSRTSEMFLDILDASNGSILSEGTLVSVDPAHFDKIVAATAANGDLLIGAGRSLVRRASLTGDVSVSTIPAGLAPPADIGDPGGGITSIADTPPDVQVTIAGRPELLALTVKAWSIKALLPVTGFDGSGIAKSADGKELVSGRGIASGQPQVASLAGGTSSLLQGLISCRGNRSSSAVCLTSARSVRRYETADSQALPEGVDVLDTPGGLRLVAVDPAESLWLWDSGMNGASVLRIQPETRTASRAIFPLAQVPSDSLDLGSRVNAPIASASTAPPVFVNPAVESLVPLDSSTAYLFTRYGVHQDVESNTYASVYLVTIN